MRRAFDPCRRADHGDRRFRFLNNIPVVVIFIPIMHMLAAHLGRHDSKIMMGLGYAAVLGGMTTLIGSGTNLLVSESLVLVGERAFHIFDFTIPGLIMAGVGLLYLLFVCPALLPDRSSLADRIATRSERHFLAEIKVAEGGKLGKRRRHGFLGQGSGRRPRSG